MDNQRPLGVTIISILLMLIGLINVFTLPVFIFSFKPSGDLYYSSTKYTGSTEKFKFKEFAASEQGKKFEKEWKALNKGFVRTLMISFLLCQKLIYISILIFGLGLFSLKEWARKMTVAVAAIQIAIAIFSNYFSYIFIRQLFRLIVKYDLYKLHDTDVSGFSKNQLLSMASAIPLIFVCISAVLMISVCSFLICYFSQSKIKGQFAISQ